MLPWKRPLPCRTRGVLPRDGLEEPFSVPPWRGAHGCAALEELIIVLPQRSPSSCHQGGALQRTVP